jgi:hypothetical protein
MLIIILAVLGISIASLLILDLSVKEKLAFFLIGISSFLTSLSFYLEIQKRDRNSKNE